MDDCDRAAIAAERHLQASLADLRAHRVRGRSRDTCRDCGGPIPEDRRRATDGCERCVFCQTKFERGL